MKILLVIAAFLLSTGVRAQVFPVQISLQVVPPYSPYISDYSAPGSENVLIHVRLNDAIASNYPCRLRVTVEGPGITLQTKADYRPQPLILEGDGITQVLEGGEVARYFEPSSMEFSGDRVAQLEITGRLPEGQYRFSTEVLDYNRGTVVSNKATATVWIVINDPPILNTPLNLSKVAVTDPVSLLFAWTPRHTGSPNSAFTTEYIFRLLELPPDGRNPYDAFASQEPLFETSTSEHHFLFGPSEPALLPGRQYAWQVQAVDAGGKDLFRNEGRSEVFVFRYGDALAIPSNLRMRWAKPTTLAIQWDPIAPESDDIRYRLKYRTRRRNEPHKWYETWTRFSEKTLYDLKSNTEYEMQIRSETSVQESEYSEIKIFKTQHEEIAEFVCSDTADPPPAPDNSLPKFPLSVNDTIHAGGYDVLVRDVAKTGSKYSGAGLAIVPWFNSAKVRVTFENIGVNEAFWLNSGTIRSVWNPDSDFFYQHETPSRPGQTPHAGDLDITVLSSDTLIEIKHGAIASVTETVDGYIEVTTTDGRVELLPVGKSYALTDALGNGYVVDERGNIAKTTAAEASASSSRAGRIYDLFLKFSRGEGRFGFDEWKYEAVSHYFQQLKDGVYIPWKALSSARPDVIHCTDESGQLDPSRVRFTPVTATSIQGGNAMLTLQGKSEGLEEELVAWLSTGDTIPAKVVGKVNLVTYNPKRYNLEIVTVNGARIPGGLDADGISEGLNDIYRQAVVEWNVTSGGNITVSLPDPFDDGEDGVFSNYTPDMKAVLRAYGPMRDNTFCLFVVGTPRDPSTLGYMPRNKSAGFLFADPHEGNPGQFIKTIAHELGHGAFNLKHVFNEHGTSPGATDNLMDYSGGTALYKYQWDYIHEPTSALALFDVSEDGASVNSAPSVFFEKAAPLLTEPLYTAWLEKVRTICKFFQACQSDDWESFDGKGIVPHCFWKDLDVAPHLYYSNADVAFNAGIIDGGYVELEGMYQLPEALRQIGRLPGKLLYAYTLAYWRCRDDALIAGVEDYEYVVGQLAATEQQSGIWNWIKEQWYDYKGEKEALESYLQDCRDAEELRETVEDLYGVIDSWEEITVLSKEVYDRLSLYWESLGNTDNVGRYRRGALIVPTASVVLPLGITGTTNVQNVEQTLQALRGTSAENAKSIAARISALLPVFGNKSALSATFRSIYDDCIAIGYTAWDEGADIMFKNKENVLVAKISKSRLHIRIPYENGWATQSETSLAWETLVRIRKSRQIYRVGRVGQSQAGEAQFWSPENPFSFPSIADYAQKYGIPEKNLIGDDIFLEVGTILNNIPFITREAPGFGNNMGGAIEVVVPPKGVKLDTFNLVNFEKP